MKILLVEDEAHIAKGLLFNFKGQGWEVDWAERGEQALEMWASGDYTLIVLDVMLPGIDGFEVARRIRQVDGKIAILMLTALAADEDRIAGLECGVDDYVSKPFVLRELLLRIAGLLRRTQWAPQSPGEVLNFGKATIDLVKPMIDDTPLTRIEIDLLRYFARNPGRLISREELLKAVWGYEPDTLTRTVDTFIMRVRKFVEPEPSRPTYLRSVRGRGYIYLPTGKE
ncbi:MAG: response regulator transcription factor [Acidobacteriota bacterium]|nr:MAG: response regulator transcription factor [Acidobacteriota bacterium]